MWTRAFKYICHHLPVKMRPYYRTVKMLSVHRHLSESSTPFSYILIFQKWQSLESPSSSQGDRHTRPLTSFCDTEYLTIFTWRNFWHNAFFFAIFEYFIISKIAIWHKNGGCLHSDCSSALLRLEPKNNRKWRRTPFLGQTVHKHNAERCEKYALC